MVILLAIAIEIHAAVGRVGREVAVRLKRDRSWIHHIAMWIIVGVAYAHRGILQWRGKHVPVVGLAAKVGGVTVVEGDAHCGVQPVAFGLQQADVLANI